MLATGSPILSTTDRKEKKNRVQAAKSVVTAVHYRLFYSLCYLPSQTEVRHDREECNLIKAGLYQNKNFLSDARAKPTLQLFPFPFQRDEW